MDIDTVTEIDRWSEDDYELVLVQVGEDDSAMFNLIQQRNGRPDRDVTEDFEAYARRIKQLIAQRQAYRI